jgi:Tol biopolymer transport system component
MGESLQSTALPERAAVRLESWKEIAAYLNRDVTTVQRWEKREGMPVHRHVHDKRGSVHAFRAELDAWANSRNLDALRPNEDNATSSIPSSPPTRVASLLKWWLGPLVVAAMVAIGTSLWLQRTDYFWRNPIAAARFQRITDFDGITQAAALSHDGQFLAFLSDRDGQMDVWITQVGSGEFHNLTRESEPELVNPSIRPLGFSPDGSLVTFWVRKQGGSDQGDISIWAVPTLGGQPRPYMEGAAELDWTRDGSRVAYHTTGPGDPLFVSDGTRSAEDHPIFIAPAGVHCHFPLWSPDSEFVYFAEGTPPDKLNIWRIRPRRGTAEQITSQGGVTYPVLLNRRILMYLAADADGQGPWLYSMDVEHRIPHRVTFGPDRYTSLAASSDGRRLALTLANAKTTLWKMHLTNSPKQTMPARIALTTSAGRSPRLGANYLVYVSSSGPSESIRKIASGTDGELWRGTGSQVIGAPAISPDGRHIAFSVLQNGQKLLYVMESDGSNARIVAHSLDLQGSPAWTASGNWITSAANDDGVPHLYRVPAAGGPSTLFLRDYSLDPQWPVGDRFVLYSGRDIGTTFSVKAVTPDGGKYDLPALTLTRGARHLVALHDGLSLVVLRGNIQHKNLSLVDLRTGAERQLTNLPSDFNIRDFDISPDGREVVLERVQERSDVVLLDLNRP